MSIELGKPADYGQFILQRRFSLVKKYAGDALKRGGTYLDVGCGNGAQTVLFAPGFAEWKGIDVEKQRLEEFQHELDRGDYQASAVSHEILLYDGDHIPLPSESVDFLTCIEVIEHTRDDRWTVGELFRVLKPGATALITVPNKWWIFETHGAHLPLLPWNRVPFFSWLPKPIHQRYAKARIYRKSQIVRILQAAGFHIEHAFYITAPMDMIKQPQLQRFVRSLLFRQDETSVPILSTSIMIIATKGERE